MSKKSKLGMTTKKSDNLMKWYTEVIQKAELADYTEVSGNMVFRPNSYSMWEIIQKSTDEKFKKIGIQNAYFPLFIPERFLAKEAEHVKGFAPEVAWVTHAGNSKLNEKLAIRPTSETIMYPSYSNWIRSWRDLPLRINQWNNVVRWEFKHPVALMRTREFLWNEGHTVFATEKEALAEGKQVLDIYRKVCEDYMALYGFTGKKTEKEKFAGAVFSEKLHYILPNGRSVEGPCFHHDGQKFAKAFDIKYLDKNEKQVYAWQNTFAITTRMLGIMINIHGDDKGLVLPPKIAPLQIVIIPIYKEKNKNKILKACKTLQKSLKSYRIKLDDREEYSPGWKFNEWELKGVPIRIEIGPKDLAKRQATVVRRDTGKKIGVGLKSVKQRCVKLFDEIHKNLLENSKKVIKSKIVQVKNLAELKKAVKAQKLGIMPFCGTIKCEDILKDKTEGIKSICIDNKKLSSKAVCGHCGKQAQFYVYFGKSY